MTTETTSASTNKIPKKDDLKKSKFLATVTCTSGYSRSPSRVCGNRQIDFNNSGSFRNVCPSTYTSCSAGVCSDAPTVQLQGVIAVAG